MLVIQSKKKNRTDYDAKISGIKSKYIIAADYNKFAKDNVAKKIKSEGLVNESYIAGL